MKLSFQQGEHFHLDIPPTEPLAYIEETLHALAKEHTTLTIIPNGEPAHVQMVLHFLTLHYPKKLAIAHDTATWKNVHSEQEVLYHKLHHLIDSNRFVAASLLLQQRDTTLQHLLTFARRLSYGQANGTHPENPNLYWQLLEQVLTTDALATKDELQFIQLMRGMTKQQQRPFIYYIHSYCKQLYMNSDLTDFITFYYRLAEEVLLYAMGWDVQGTRAYIKRIGATQYVVLPTPKQNVTRHFFRYLRHAEQQSSPFAEQIVRDFSATWLLDIIHLRHNGISGHGFEPYTKERIEEICGGDPLDKMDELLARYDLLPPHCFYTLLKEAMAARARLLVPAT
ncbi:hypothetical protein [Caryophanon latum]|uniref:Uncharacterized protein n=1 Tax=Caryophanon latum TaxID=33977 RepID=A0A1C0Y6K4_9BACL|nr:hypothetical protein [Caryophanon latum]OCS82796.1 hypothetical protein A6K76_16275 [Caryophanon latum]